MIPGIINSPNTRGLIAKRNTNGGRLPKKVAILYSDVKRKYFPTYEQYLTEKDARYEASSFIPYLKELNIKPVLIPADANMANRIRFHKPDLVIDLVCSVRGWEYLSSTAPATLELLEIPYTGASMLGFNISMNKYFTKELLGLHGIPVPKFQLFTSWRQPLNDDMKFPVILKLNEMHGSVEITNDSIIENAVSLRRRLKYLMKTYDQDILAEEFIEGREIEAFIFQSYNKKVYLVERELPEGKNRFLDFNTVWQTDEKDYEKVIKLKKYSDPLLTALVKKAFSVVKMDDYGKFDIRMDQYGKYYFIDSNPNCYFTPPEYYSEITMTMKMYGVPFRVLLKRLLQNTMREWGY
jgi:D-alanine-D-alanine ligase